MAAGGVITWKPNGPDCSPVGWGLLHHAVNNGNIDRIEWLMDKKYDEAPPLIATKAMREAHAKEQKERWANDAADQTGLTPLMIASRNNNLEIILLLLEAGAQLGKVDTAKRWSALHWATCYASTETVG